MSDPGSEGGGRRDTVAHLVEAAGLTKRFGDLTAVNAVDFHVDKGEVFGFLGPNGAGKTSTMRMIAAVSPRNEGHLRVFDLDPDSDGRQIRARLGVVPQENRLDEELTVEENLYIYGRYFDLPGDLIRSRVKELLAFAHLSDRHADKVEPLSGGMKRRLTIARALVNDPDLVVLDEPTTGLDPQARHALWDRLYRLKQEGATLLLTTHYMDEAEQLCDRLVVMNEGRIIAEGSPLELIRRHATREVVELRFAVGHQPPESRFEAIAKRAEMLPDRVLLYTEDAEGTIAAADERGIRAEAVLTRRSTLEDVFLHLTGRMLVD
ncbi:MAG: ABC transporter ATP-binding protein [Nitriliruptorales bacterium]